MSGAVYILQWYDGTSPRIRWFLRGIKEDGSFYGEIQSKYDPPRRTGETVIGGTGTFVDDTLSPRESARFRELVAQIVRDEQCEPTTWEGLLAEGSIQAPKILLHYTPSNPLRADENALFLEIVHVFMPHLQPYYSVER